MLPQAWFGFTFLLLFRSFPSSLLDVKYVGFSMSESSAVEGNNQNKDEPVISWEIDAANQLREMIVQRYGSSNSPRSHSPFLVGLVGVPGSGKTTSASIIAELLRECVVIPMDGYHYPIDVLQKFPDPEDAIYRRGAPDTFDSRKLQTDLERIKNDQGEAVVSIPGFDHAKGNPEPDKHCFIRSQHKIVLCEGLYLLHDKNGWENVSTLLDYSIYISADVDTCIERLKERNKCIPGYTPEQIDLRCNVVDRANALTVERSKSRAQWIAHSVFSSKKANQLTNTVTSIKSL